MTLCGRRAKDWIMCRSLIGALETVRLSQGHATLDFVVVVLCADQWPIWQGFEGSFRQ